jgi:membrane associated rhomboid family serine protease
MEFNHFIKRQEKQKKNTIKDFENFRESRARGTIYLILLIFIMSLFSFIHPLYLTLSSLSFVNFWFWTLITSFFVSYTDFYGLFLLIFLILVFYIMLRNLEQTFGTIFLFKLYFLCGFMTGASYVLLWLVLQRFYYGTIIIPIGLASGAFLGLICFPVFLNFNKDIIFRFFFIPIRMKGKIIIVILFLSKLIPGLLLAIGNPLYLLIYIPDLGGGLGSYLIYLVRYKNR